MDDDWDLQAVVRGCAASMTTTNNPFPSFPSLPFQDDQSSSFDFPDDGNNNDPLHGLQEIYQEFCCGDLPPTAAAATTSIMSAPATQPHQEIVQIKPPFQMNMLIQENADLHGSFPQAFQATLPQAQPVRPRRRKNQQVKMVRLMTQEELSADSWAWRKYGQKPIKGSPYPRNYYRCNTSKGCAARKQVERNPNDPGTFVVTYTGEHTHPRPSHRSSLAGSTRSRFSSPPARNNYSLSFQKASSFSATTPSMEVEVAIQNEMVEEEEEGNGEINNIIIIANDDDDLLKGFEDSDHSRDSEGFLPSSSWSPATGPTQ